MFTITLTKEEIEAAISLLDVAVRAQGLGVANAAYVLASKLQSATPVKVEKPEA